MKKYALLLLFALNISDSFAQEVSVEDFGQLKKEVFVLKQQIGSQKITVAKQQNKISSLQAELGKSQTVIDSLQSQVGDLATALSSAEDRLGTDIANTNQSVESHANTLKETISNNFLFGIIFMLAFAVLAALGYYLLRRKVSSSDAAIGAVKDAQKKLEEEAIKLDNQLVDILNNQLNAKPVQSQPAAPDHSLVRKVADEIVRIELNLSRMDPSIKGCKQLSKGIERIKDNFKAKGYEITDMLGKPYAEGMKAVVSFVSDDTLPEGSQIITGIIKPQILYNGMMIQSAEITVSQNN